MERYTRRIFHLRISRSAGFSLIEVMIVLFIIASASGFLLNRINKSGYQFKESIRKIGVLSRDIRYRAKLQNVTYRLAINMYSGEESEEPHEYWVERGSGPSLFTDMDNYSPYEEGEEEEGDRGKEEKKPEFQIDTSLTPEKKELLGGLIFEDVEVVSLSEKVSSGIVYIYYLPEGLVDESAIHIKRGEETQWTLTIHPLTGRVESLKEYIRLDDILER